MSNEKIKDGIFLKRFFVFIIVLFVFQISFVLSVITSEDVNSKIFQTTHKQNFENRVLGDLGKNVSYFDLLNKDGIKVSNSKRYNVLYSMYYYFYSYSDEMFLPTKTHSEFNSALIASSILLETCSGDIQIPYYNKTIAEQTLSSMGFPASLADRLLKNRIILKAHCNTDGTLDNWRLFLYCRYVNNGYGYRETKNGLINTYECYDCVTGKTKTECNYKTETDYKCTAGFWEPTGTTRTYSCSGCTSKTCTPKTKTEPKCTTIYGPEGRIVDEVCSDVEVPDGEECSC